jgi:hypothetical protein
MNVGLTEALATCVECSIQQTVSRSSQTQLPAKEENTGCHRLSNVPHGTTIRKLTFSRSNSSQNLCSDALPAIPISLACWTGLLSPKISSYIATNFSFIAGFRFELVRNSKGERVALSCAIGPGRSIAVHSGPRPLASVHLSTFAAIH